MRTLKWRVFVILSLLFSIALAFSIGRSSAAAPGSRDGYAYATAGVWDQLHVAGIDWKILLNQSNLGGQELEMVAATFPAGMLSPSHTHKSVEMAHVSAPTCLDGYVGGAESLPACDLPPRELRYWSCFLL